MYVYIYIYIYIYMLKNRFFPTNGKEITEDHLGHQIHLSNNEIQT